MKKILLPTIILLATSVFLSAQSEDDKPNTEIPRHEVGLDISFFMQMFSSYTYFENASNIEPGLGALEVFYKYHKINYAWRGSLAYRELDDVVPFRFFLAKAGVEGKLYNNGFTTISVGADLLAGVVTARKTNDGQLPVESRISEFTAGVAPFISIDFKTGTQKNIGFGMQVGPEFVYVPNKFYPYDTSLYRKKFEVVPFSIFSRIYLSYGF